MTFDLASRRVFVAGHRGMVGSAIVRRLAGEGCTVLTASRAELDLQDQAAVRTWFGARRPDAVFVAAAKVGGILANQDYPADFLYENLMIAANVVEAAHRADVAKLLLLGSSAVYPRLAAQPMAEAALLSGPLEPTHEAYAIAKIAGVKLCEAYRRQHGRDYVSVLPTNLYGPGDSFDLSRGHVMPSLIRKAHEAKVAKASSLSVWGTGKPRREFLYVDDCADACVHVMKHYSGEQHVNIGSGEDLEIAEVVSLVCDVVGFSGEIVHDTSKPDGPPRKLMDNRKLFDLGWRPTVDLREGIARTYAAFLQSCGTS